MILGIVGVGVLAAGGCGSSDEPQAKDVGSIPKCQDLVTKDEVGEALGKQVEPDSLLNGDSTFYRCAYQAKGGKSAVVISVEPQPLPAGSDTDTKFHGNAAKMNDKPLGSTAVCAIRVQLNPKDKQILNINTRIPTKENKNPCDVTKELLGIAFERIPNA